MKYRTIPFLMIAIISITGCSGLWVTGSHDEFITVQGIHFRQGEKPYYFVGTNLWYACYLGAPGKTGNRARLIRELDSLNALGIDNVRILAGSESTDRIRTVKPVIILQPGEVNDSLLLGLDYVLSELAERKMKAVLYLTNYWEWSGGMTEYIRWADGTPSFDPNAEGWGKYMNYAASFYKNEKANQYFRNYIQGIIERKNSCNGRKYSADPAIMAWQLANEPRPGTNTQEGTDNLPYFYKWIEETAAFIKSLDTNHLVSTGNEGLAGCLQSEESYRTAHRIKNIDYLTVHVWPLNWGWFNPKEFEKTLQTSIDSATFYLCRHIQYARELKKPLVLEEFGIGRDAGAYLPGTPVTARDKYYEAMLALMYDSARAGSPVAGSNFWGWGGEGRGVNADFFWKEGDDFTGDPPQEPQGQNSIFISDRSTADILRMNALRMRRLRTDNHLMTPEK